MTDRPARRARACATTPTDRIVRGVVAVFAAAFSLNQLDNLWCAIPAATCAVLLTIGAITGWCPTDLLRRPTAPEATNALGYPEARQRVDVR